MVLVAAVGIGEGVLPPLLFGHLPASRGGKAGRGADGKEWLRYGGLLESWRGSARAG